MLELRRDLVRPLLGEEMTGDDRTTFDLLGPLSPDREPLVRLALGPAQFQAMLGARPCPFA